MHERLRGGDDDKSMFLAIKMTLLTWPGWFNSGLGVFVLAWAQAIARVK